MEYYIGNKPLVAREQDLAGALYPYAKKISVGELCDPQGRPRSYCYIETEQDDLDTHEIYLMGRRLIIEKTREYSEYELKELLNED